MTTRLFLCLCLAFLLTGCFETKDEYTFNSDGSGKVVHETYFNSISFDGERGESSEAKLKSEVIEILEKSQGVDAWKDVSYELAKDGRMFFRGTAYFPDVNKLKLQHSMLKLTTRKDSSGNLVIEARSENTTNAVKEPPKQLSEADILKLIKERRAEFQQAKPMIAGIFGNMKHSVFIDASSGLESHTNFHLVDGKLSLTFNGTNLVQAFDKFIVDDEFMRRHVLDGGKLLDGRGFDDDRVNRAALGKRGPTQAVVAKTQSPVFNYAEEKAAADENFLQTRKKLAITLSRIPPATGSDLKSVQVVGSRFTAAKTVNRLMPFFHQTPGYTLSMSVEFPGTVVEVKGRLHRAIADNGENLMSGEQSNGNLQSMQLSFGKTNASFDLHLQTPAKGVQGFKEISGELEYVAAAGTKWVDLGFPEIKEKAEGSELAAVIEIIETGARGKQLTLQLRLAPERLVGLRLVDAAGKESKLERRGYGVMKGGVYKYTFEHKGAISSDGKLVVETFDQLQSYIAPFKLENIDLFGRPK